jgi:hypothetical protein
MWPWNERNTWMQHAGSVVLWSMIIAIIAFSVAVWRS